MSVVVGILVWVGTGSFCLGIAAFLVVGYFIDVEKKD